MVAQKGNPKMSSPLSDYYFALGEVLGLLVLIAVREARSVYLDVALVYDIFGFVGLLAITRYLAERRRRA